jgi:hypothetical protein
MHQVQSAVRRNGVKAEDPSAYLSGVLKGTRCNCNYAEMRQLYTHLQCSCGACGQSQHASYANYHVKRNTLPNVIGIHHTSRSVVRREAGESTCCNLQCHMGARNGRAVATGLLGVTREVICRVGRGGVVP